DGIRDGHVTGVQTCALPIYARPEQERVDEAEHRDVGADPQGKGEDDGEREAGAAGERAERVAEVIHIAEPPSDRPSSPGARAPPPLPERRRRGATGRPGTSPRRWRSRRTADS